jgi:UDP-N-acetylglucosamine 4,6-dehydratase
MSTKKIVTVFGGTGSFGNELVRYFNLNDYDEIRIFSRDEKKQDDMRNELNSSKIKFYIGDVRDLDSVHQSLINSDIAFYAAALKQVPSCEFFPMEAVKTNIHGAENVIKSCITNKVKKCIFLSTDKAVYPINSMGLSKALMEKVVIAYGRSLRESSTVLACTRYGNVIASRGSVIPLFVSQIKNQKSITITNPLMTRFMMSLEDSVNLVMHAINNASQGDIYIQKAPSATIQQIADVLIEIFNSSSKIEIIGTRHGEKLYETLVSQEEMIRAVDENDYFRIPSDNRDLNFKKYISIGKKNIQDIQDYNSHNTYKLTNSQLKKILLNIDFIKDSLK